MGIKLTVNAEKVWGEGRMFGTQGFANFVQAGSITQSQFALKAITESGNIHNRNSYLDGKTALTNVSSI